MSETAIGTDRAAAVEAAAQATFEAWHPGTSATWEDMPEFYRAQWRERVTPAVTAALEVVEATVREAERLGIAVRRSGDGWDVHINGALLMHFAGTVDPI